MEVEVERIGGDLVARSVQFVVEPDGATDFFGTPNALLFEPGVRSRKATILAKNEGCLLYTSPSPRDSGISRMPSSA